jgi:WhiB family transcriptional regulator, redox-sensing transcriptional regulator
VRARTYDRQTHTWYYLAVDESWAQYAACRGEDPELFYPEVNDERGLYNQRVRDALQVCVDCPVVDQCLQYALVTDTRHGVWGGTTEIERARMLGRKRAY